MFYSYQKTSLPNPFDLHRCVPVPEASDRAPRVPSPSSPDVAYRDPTTGVYQFPRPAIEPLVYQVPRHLTLLTETLPQIHYQKTPAPEAVYKAPIVASSQGLREEDVHLRPSVIVSNPGLPTEMSS